jgi:metal-responsive CopG/Arc/MetJ family transcriptional regulator
MSISVTQKKRGRPATGRDPHLTLRLPEELLKAVEHHAAATGETRSEAIRRLIEAGLEAKGRKASKSGKG